MGAGGGKEAATRRARTALCSAGSVVAGLPAGGLSGGQLHRGSRQSRIGQRRLSRLLRQAPAEKEPAGLLLGVAESRIQCEEPFP